jgi:hypothetical protein
MPACTEMMMKMMMSRRAPEFRVITPRSSPPAAQFPDARARYVCAIAVVSELDHPVPQSGGSGALVLRLGLFGQHRRHLVLIDRSLTGGPKQIFRDGRASNAPRYASPIISVSSGIVSSAQEASGVAHW